MKEMHLMFTQYILTFVGFWPLETKSKAVWVLYKCQFGLSMLISSTFLVSLTLEAWTVRSQGMKAFGTNVAIALNFFYNLIQVHSSTWPGARVLLRKIHDTERYIMEKGTPEVKMLFLQELKRHRAFNIIFFSSGIVLAVSYTVSPWIIKYTDLSDSNLPAFPLDAWFPFDKYTYYKTAFVYTVVSGSTAVIYTAGSFCFYFGMIQFALTQFTILKHEIMTGIDGQLNDSEVQQNVRKIIVHYNNIIKFVQQLNGVIRYMMLAACAIFVEQISVVGFQVATEALSVQLMKSITFINCLLLELFLYYWLANELTLENYNIATTIWNSDWYNCSTSVKKSLVLIIMRSQRPLQLSVGPFYFMSNETMIMILKSGVSYAGALRKFHMVKMENEKA